MWVISVIYPLFLAVIFHECFFSKKRYFFHDVATIWTPLYCCVVSCLHAQGYCTIRLAKCKLIQLFLQCIATRRSTWIWFSLLLLKLNACRICILVITPNNLDCRMRDLGFWFEIFKKSVVSQIEMRRLAIM